MKYLLLIGLFVGLNSDSALIQQTVSPQGVSANYWKVTNASLNKISMTLQCSLGLFVDQASADSGNVALTTKTFRFPVVKADVTSDIVAACYSKIESVYVNPSPSPAPQPKDTSLIGATNG